eukprot:3379911-Prymnesium_polylepis.1
MEFLPKAQSTCKLTRITPFAGMRAVRTRRGTFANPSRTCVNPSRPCANLRGSIVNPSRTLRIKPFANA